MTHQTSKTGKKRTILGIVLLLLLPLIAWVSMAHAQEFRSGDNVTVSGNQTLNSSLWSSGKHLDIAGTVNGDIFCIGQTVNISAVVNGDVICAGQNIHISGPVNGDVRMAGQELTISSKISGSVSAAGQSFSLDQSGSVGRDVSAAVSDATFNGTVSRDLAAAGSTVTINNKVGRTVKATAKTVRLGSGAKVGGDLNYTSNNSADIASGATIAGATHHSQPPQSHAHAPFKAFSILFALYVIVTLLIVALVFALLFPALLTRVSAEALDRPWRTLLVGFIAGFLFPIIFIALLLTLVGIPLALLLLVLWTLIVAFGGIFFSFYVGRLILRGPRNAVLVMLVGALIVLILTEIPFLGILVSLAAFWMGTGMVLQYLFHRYERPQYTLPER
jgi:cytoskeletal protein CcmA (bactofilin family)